MVDIADVMHNSLRSAVKRQRPQRPDPEPTPIRYPVVSADDHLMEPRHLFEGRLPRKFADATPRVVEDDDGMEAWDFEGVRVENTGGNAMSTWLPEDRYAGEIRFDEVRPGHYDPERRLRDMDVDGVVASLCFPSMVYGFCGQRFMKFKDPELGLACMRAYNDWVLEEWVAANPSRFIPQQVTWLLDAGLASEEIRRNAERGFKAVTFSENPEALGLPSLHTGYWDPFFRACEETGTVVNLHTGSSSTTVVPSADAPPPVLQMLFPVNAFSAAANWLFALIPVKFPSLKIVLSESTIGWVRMFYDRLSFADSRFHIDNDGGVTTPWRGFDVTPLEAAKRSFWFTAFWDPSVFANIDSELAARVMLEVDYPHADSTWPDTQSGLDAQIGHLPQDLQRKVTWENASSVYRHPLPDPPSTLFGPDAAVSR